MSVAGRGLTGRISYPGCGVATIILTAAVSGDIGGIGRNQESQDCSQVPFTASGRITGERLTLEPKTNAGAMRGTLSRR